MKARNAKTKWAFGSAYGIALAIGIILYTLDMGLGVSIVCVLLTYAVLVVALAPLVKYWELNPTARRALEYLNAHHSGGPRVPIDGGHVQGRGTIAGEPLFLTARFRRSGIVVSIHYTPSIRPRNFTVAWEDVAGMCVEDGEFAFGVRGLPGAEIRFPHSPSREFTTYVGPRMQGSSGARGSDV